MIADSFSIDMHCACLNLPLAEEYTDDSERNRSMSPETSIARLPSKPRSIARPSRKPGYVLPRLVWMAIGPGLLMMLSVLKMESHAGQPGPIEYGIPCGCNRDPPDSLGHVARWRQMRFIWRQNECSWTPEVYRACGSAGIRLLDSGKSGRHSANDFVNRRAVCQSRIFGLCSSAAGR